MNDLTPNPLNVSLEREETAQVSPSPAALPTPQATPARAVAISQPAAATPARQTARGKGCQPGQADAPVIKIC